MDVTTAAWMAAGCPRLRNPGRGSCARCARPELAAAVRDVVSGNFTGWDDWINPASAGLCGSCAWAYREPCLRLLPTLVRAAGPDLIHPGPQDLAGLLRQPVPPGAALIIPLRPGRKHLLPAARWSRISIDDGPLPWGPADAARLQAMQRLRQAGFGTRMLAAPAPAYPVLRRLPSAARAAVLADWDLLRDWRQRPPWLHLAAYVTLPAAAPRHARLAACPHRIPAGAGQDPGPAVPLTASGRRR